MGYELLIMDNRRIENIPDDALMTPSEVAVLFRVSPKTVTRWARAGKLTAIRTLGGHRRFRAGEVREILRHANEEAQTGRPPDQEGFAGRASGDEHDLSQLAPGPEPFVGSRGVGQRERGRHRDP